MRTSVAVNLLLKNRRTVVVAFHLFLIGLSNYIAFWLRFDGDIPRNDLRILATTLPLLVAVRAVIFVPFRLYEGLWRYTGIWDLRNIIAGVVTSSATFYLIVWWGLGAGAYPRAVVVIDSLVLISVLGMSRLSRRIYREFVSIERDKKVLIYGAGDAGEMVARDMRNNPFYEYEPVGFIDDDPRKAGQRIHGLKVLGTREELQRILVEIQPDAVLIAMPRTAAATIRSIVRSLESFKVPIQTLPSLRDVLNGKVAVSHIRALSIEDLLERAPVPLDRRPLRHLIEGKRVLITGAGGSIGSELARQIAGLAPAALVLLDRYENGLYLVTAELTGEHPNGVSAVVGDVTDPQRMNEVMASYRPQILFHAAAHKHVPLMESNPCEAVKNNVRGTRIVAETALRVGVDCFVLISTDKAVAPASVMGATKRVAELLVQSANRRAVGVFTSVRFGNVLASNGSVVPRFLAQIKAGGPVTVTHPDMRRYFMLIPEAVHLILHAAAIAEGGDVFVLEMGEQVKVLDLARHLIRLSGFVPDDDVRITYIGIRPGEKLYEELVGKDEVAHPSAVDRIFRVEPAAVSDPTSLTRQVTELELLAERGENSAVIERLCELVSAYQPAKRDHVEPPPVPADAARAPCC